MKLKKDFLQRLEEEKRPDEIEEDEKSPDEGEEEESEEMRQEGENAQMNDFSLDQIALMLSKCVIFCQISKWE